MSLKFYLKNENHLKLSYLFKFVNEAQEIIFTLSWLPPLRYLNIEHLINNGD